MCLDYDLFGDVIVTIDDINFWLDLVPRMQGNTNQRRNYYAEHSDIASKIKLSKINGSFKKLIDDFNIDELYDCIPLEFISTKYKQSPDEMLLTNGCPSYFHICQNVKCGCYIKVIAHEKSAARYANKKEFAKRLK